MLTEFAIRVEPTTDPKDGAREGISVYKFIATTPIRPCGFLFWGPFDSKVFSIRVNDTPESEQLCADAPVNAFLNIYASLEHVEHFVKHKVKLKYTNLILPTMKTGDSLIVKTTHPTVVCLCGIMEKKI